MQIDLKGLRALVTGSTAGIGEAIAGRLAQNGAEVVINGRTAERVSKAIVALQAKAPGARFLAAPGDVSTAKGCEAIVAAAGKVDILVNNAGWFEPKDAFEICDADCKKPFNTNVMSAFPPTRALAPPSPEQASGEFFLSLLNQGSRFR